MLSYIYVIGNQKDSLTMKFLNFDPSCYALKDIVLIHVFTFISRTIHSSFRKYIITVIYDYCTNLKLSDSPKKVFKQTV